MMEINGRASRNNEKKPLENSAPPANVPKKPSENNSSTSIFVNHAAIAWDEMRRKWIGNAPQRSDRTMKDPIISWSTTYEDLLSTHEPFSEPIPLPIYQTRKNSLSCLGQTMFRQRQTSFLLLYY